MGHCIAHPSPLTNIDDSSIKLLLALIGITSRFRLNFGLGCNLQTVPSRRPSSWLGWKVTLLLQTRTVPMCRGLLRKGTATFIAPPQTILTATPPGKLVRTKSERFLCSSRAMRLMKCPPPVPIRLRGRCAPRRRILPRSCTRSRSDAHTHLLARSLARAHTQSFIMLSKLC